MANSDLPQSLDTSLFGTTAAGFQQGPLDMDDVSGVYAGPLASLSSLAVKNHQEPQALIPSSKLTVDTDALTLQAPFRKTVSQNCCHQPKRNGMYIPTLTLFAQEEETQFGFSNLAGNHGSQKETDLITVIIAHFGMN